MLHDPDRISEIGCRCLYATHFHELAGMVPEMNSQTKGVKFDNLSVGIEKNSERTFKLSRRAPDGKSYARDIAKEYGLTLKSIEKLTVENNELSGINGRQV